MTFVRTREGWLNLAVLVDLYSRKVVGWAMGPQPNQALALGALDMALAHRRPRAGLVHHTDRGATYSASAYRERLQQAGFLPSMSGRKSAYDNAVAESFFSNLKNELVKSATCCHRLSFHDCPGPALAGNHTLCGAKPVPVDKATYQGPPQFHM